MQRGGGVAHTATGPCKGRRPKPLGTQRQGVGADRSRDCARPVGALVLDAATGDRVGRSQMRAAWTGTREVSPRRPFLAAARLSLRAALRRSARRDLQRPGPRRTHPLAAYLVGSRGVQGQGILPRHGTDQRALPEPRGRLPVSRDRAARAGVPAGAPGRAGDPPRHRRRGAAPRARGDRGPPRRGGRDGNAAGFPRLRPRPRVRLPGRGDPRARLPHARHRDRERRDLRLRRQQAGLGQHPGDLRLGLQDGGLGPRLPGLRGHERDGGPRRQGRRLGPPRGHPLSAHRRGERLRAGAAARARRRRLPVLAEQPHRHRARRARSSSAGSRGRAPTTPC